MYTTNLTSVTYIFIISDFRNRKQKLNYYWNGRQWLSDCWTFSKCSARLRGGFSFYGGFGLHLIQIAVLCGNPRTRNQIDSFTRLSTITNFTLTSAYLYIYTLMTTEQRYRYYTGFDNRAVAFVAVFHKEKLFDGRKNVTTKVTKYELIKRWRHENGPEIDQSDVIATISITNTPHCKRVPGSPRQAKISTNTPAGER